jgi:hypothetical protein
VIDSIRSAAAEANELGGCQECGLPADALSMLDETDAILHALAAELRALTVPGQRRPALVAYDDLVARRR